MSDDLPTLYLIAHKVRGQPAFDVATCEEVEGEEMWIIPTSGHRAYPSGFVRISTETVDGPHGSGICVCLAEPLAFLPTPPPDLCDHYTTSASPRPSPTAGRDILSTLGLIKPAEPIKRRI